MTTVEPETLRLAERILEHRRRQNERHNKRNTRMERKGVEV